MSTQHRRLQPVLSWAAHDRRHPPNPFSASEAGRYVLDETNTPGVRVCARCGRLVRTRT